MIGVVITFTRFDPETEGGPVEERYGDLDEAAGAADAIACSGAAVCVG